jgi:YgiT-type zinc finger domain-containing protein
MTCVICKHGNTRAETTRVALERDNTVLVVRRVPAQVCESCGEAYVDANAVDRLRRMLDEATGAGIQVEVREYAAA